MIRLLSAGVDSLYLSARADVEGKIESLREARARAGAIGEPVPLCEVEGFAFEVLPYGLNSYPVVLRCEEFTVCVTDRRNRPPVAIQLGSAFIQTVGVDEAWRIAGRVASLAIGVTLREIKVSRVDLFADFADWRLHRSDWDGFITHAKVRAIGQPAPSEVETFQVGKSPCLLRLYRKDIEIRDKGGFAHVFWQGHEGAVVRVEVQVSSDELRKYGFASVEETLASCGDIWRRVTTKFLEVRVPGPGPREAWPLALEWELVQRVAFESFPYSGVVPQAIWRGDREKVARLLYGCLVSVGAFEGIGELAAVLGLVGREVAAIAVRKDFGKETRKRRRKWSRSARSAAVDSAAASAGAGSEEVPCAPEHSQPDTAARTST